MNITVWLKTYRQFMYILLASIMYSLFLIFLFLLFLLHLSCLFILQWLSCTPSLEQCAIEIILSYREQSTFITVWHKNALLSGQKCSGLIWRRNHLEVLTGSLKLWMAQDPGATHTWLLHPYRCHRWYVNSLSASICLDTVRMDSKSEYLYHCQ